MKKKLAVLACCSFFGLLQLLDVSAPALADTGPEFSALPPSLSMGAPPLVMLALGRDHKLYYEAYNDASDLNEDGELDVHYVPSIDYYGYFDSRKCYAYDRSANLFVPTSVTADKRCVGAGADDKWSGNFLNYLTMSRMDTIRKVLYGGYRSVDTDTETVLQRVFIPQDAHSWGKEYTSVAVDGYDIADYTPFSAPQAAQGRRHLFASTTLNSPNDPPLLRYALDNPRRIWNWVSKEAPVADNSIAPEGTYTTLPNNRAGFEQFVLDHAVPARFLGSMSWLNYRDRNKVGQLTPGASAAAFGAIDGGGNPLRPSSYGPTDNRPGLPAYNRDHAEQNGYMLIFTGTLQVTQGGEYRFAVDGDDSVQVIIDGGTPNQKVAGWYGAHGRRGVVDNPPGDRQVAVQFAANSRHTIEFRIAEQASEDYYHLSWRGPDSSNAWQIVPASKFSDLKVEAYTLMTALPIVDLQVRVRVCDPAVGLEKNCQQYPNGNFKPYGILQERGEPKLMYFGLITGSYAKNTSGGVLRKGIGDIGDEIIPETGVFRTAANTAGYTGGIIQTINNLRIYGYSYANRNYSSDNCGWITQPPFTNGGFREGRCRDWGNPIAEIMYEGMRYFAGERQPTPAFDYSGATNDDALKLPKANWNNPYNKADGGFDYCSKPFLLVLSDINPSYDTDQLPGNYFQPFGGSTIGGMDVKELAKKMTEVEGLAGLKFIGQSGTTSDYNCSAKDMSAWGLGAFRGLCPEEPTKQGGYYAGAVAHYGKITDLNAAPGDQKVTTLAVGLASPLPKIEVNVGGRLVTLVPFGKTVSTRGQGEWNYKPNNTIVDFYVEEITPTYGKFQINFEDVEQGADHDMDSLVAYEYWLVDNAGNPVSDPARATRLKVTLTALYASGSYIQHSGYFISGTTQDKAYLVVRDTDTAEGEDVFVPGLDTAPEGVTNPRFLPQTSTRVFTPNTGTTTAAELLQDPLWYAGKWGGFNDQDDSETPNSAGEWDADGNGMPDNYFFVVNPLKLEQQLRKAFDELGGQAISSTAVAVGASSSSGEGATYQSLFFPEQLDNAGNKVKWTGEIRAFMVDATGNLREDTKANKRLDIKGPDLNGDGKVLHEDINLNCVLDTQTIDVNGDGILDANDLVITEDTNGNGRLDIESASGTCVPGSWAFLSELDAIVEFVGNTVNKYYDVNGNGKLDPHERLFSVGEKNVKPSSLALLWSSSTWLKSVKDTEIAEQRSPYLSKDRKRYIFTWVDRLQGGVRNGEVDAGEVQNFVWTPGTTATDLANPNVFYSYLNLYPSFEDRPAEIDTLAAQPALFREFLLKQTERQVKWLRGLDDATSLTLSDGTEVSAAKLRKRSLDEETWRLGDIIHSDPTLVAAPAEGYNLMHSDRTYDVFYGKYRSRRAVLYAGANDGMLHAFNAGFYRTREKQFCRELNPAYNPYDNESGNDNPCVSDTTTTSPELGAELWAYAPYNLLPHLYWTTEESYGGTYHVYYVDSRPRIFDVKAFKQEDVCANINDPGCIHPHGWGTIMIVGMRLGGAALHADLNKEDGKTVQTTDPEMRSAFIIMDITNPEQPPVLLGEIVMPKMGFALNKPTIMIMKDDDKNREYTDSENRWFLAFGSGPADEDGAPNRILLNQVESRQYGHFYLLDLVELATNRKLQSLTTDAATPLKAGVHPYFTLSGADEANSFIGDPISVDFENDYNADAIYFGTVTGTATSGWSGKMRRIVIDNKPDPKDWIPDSVLYNADRPISAAPASGMDRSRRNWVFFGTGRYFDVQDRLDTSTQSVFGVKEPQRTQPDGKKTSSFAEVGSADLVNVTNYQVLSDSRQTVYMNGNKRTWRDLVNEQRGSGGWRIDLLDSPNLDDIFAEKTVQKGERFLEQPLLYGGALLFTTDIPSDNVCEAGGLGRTWGRYFETGTDYYKPIFFSRTVLIDGSNEQLNVSVYESKGSGRIAIHGGSNSPDNQPSVIINREGEGQDRKDLNTPFSVRSGKFSWDLIE